MGAIEDVAKTLALVAASLTIGSCAGSRETNAEIPRWKQLEQTCNAADNPRLGLVGETLDVAISVPVEIDPDLDVQTRWAAAARIWEDERSWYSTQIVTDQDRLRTWGKRTPLRMELAHYENGSLDLTLLPWAGGYFGTWAWAEIIRIDGELRAELGGGSYSDVPDGQSGWWDLRSGELRLSSASWVAGDDLDFFLELVLEHEHFCGELRFVVPEPGHVVSIHCERRKCISSIEPITAP